MYLEFTMYFVKLALFFVGGIALIYLIGFIFRRFKSKKGNNIESTISKINKNYRNMTWILFTIGCSLFFLFNGFILFFSFHTT